MEDYIRLGEAAEGYARVNKRFNDLANSTDSIQYELRIKTYPDIIAFFFYFKLFIHVTIIICDTDVKYVTACFEDDGLLIIFL